MDVELFAVAAINALGSDCGSISHAISTNSLGSPLVEVDDLLLDRSCYAGRIPSVLSPLPKSLRSLDSRFAKIIQELYLQIEVELSQLKKLFGEDRIGVVFGSSTSGVDRAEDPFIEYEKNDSFPDDYCFFHQELGAGSKILSSLAGISGPSYTISTACSSSAKVFASGRSMLELGICDAVVVGGVDSLCRITSQGFDSLHLIAKSISNPMSRNRDGLNLGEGGALFILVNSASGVQLLGVGESTDAYHIASPDPDGFGAELAMKRALDDARRCPEDVCYLNMHGTGTVNNDSMESKAIERLLGLKVPCSSTKPLTGHLLGAAGACEAAICYSMLSGDIKTLPNHHWDGLSDPNLPEISLTSAGESFVLSERSVLLSNSFAFGGSNCCLAFGLGD